MGGLAALGFGVDACAPKAAARPQLAPRRPPLRLAQVNVSWDRIIRTTIGLRPHRPSGFVLRAEQLDGKTLIHNFGHGGSGMSLSWGTASMATDIAMPHLDRKAAVMGSGVVAGFPVVDVKVQLVDGKYHDVDSSALAFEIASRAAFREALQKGKSVLLEPIMKVEVVTPEDYTGGVIGDLNSRRGQIQGQDMRGNAVVVNAMVPLANMFGYVNTLRSMSQGRATYTMQFDHYEQVPSNVAAEVQAKYA